MKASKRNWNLAINKAFAKLKPIVDQDPSLVTNDLIRRESEKALNEFSPKGWSELDLNAMVLTLLGG